MFGLVDCNNFYVACERLFDPRLLGKAVIVLSSNDGNVVARSPEAKALGVAMGEPAYQLRARQRTHHIIMRSSNFALYGDISRRVMQTVATLIPQHEVYSIDEAFLDLTGVDDPLALCHALRARIMAWCGIAVSVGIAPTKTLAKCANALAKRAVTHDGVVTLALGPDCDSLLARMALTDVWGIGERSAARLAPLHLTTARDLRDADPTALQAALGITGRRVAEELQGVVCLPLGQSTPDRKSLCVSRSFGTPIRDREHLAQALATFVTNAAATLRRREQQTAHLQFFAQNSHFRTDEAPISRTVQVRLAIPSQDTSTLLSHLTQAMPQLFVTGTRYTSAGVLCANLSASTSVQTSLFADPLQSARRLTMLATVDRLNERHHGIITFGATGLQATWTPKAAARSPHWTTDWNDLPVAT